MGAIQHSGFRSGRGRLGDLLRAQGVVSEEQIVEAVACAHRRGTRLGSALVELGHADVDQINDALARQLGVVACRDDDLRVIATPVASVIPAAVARSLCAIPVRIIGGHTVMVAMRDPGDEDAITELWRRTGMSIRPVVAAEDAIVHAIDHLYGPPGEAPLVAPPMPEMPPRVAVARTRSASYSGALMPHPPTASPAPSRGRWPAIAIAVGALAAVGGGLLMRGGGAATEAVPAHVTSSLGLHAYLGSGWQRIRDDSAPLNRLGVLVSSEVYVRGEPEEPTEVLALLRAEAPGVSVERWAREVAEGGLPLRSWWQCSAPSASGCVVGLRCQPDVAVHDGGAVCAGEASHDGASYPVTTWLWPIAGDGVVMLVWAPRGDEAIAPDHAVAIARSIELK